MLADCGTGACLSAPGSAEHGGLRCRHRSGECLQLWCQGGSGHRLTFDGGSPCMQTSQRTAHAPPGCRVLGRPAARRRGLGSHAAAAARRGGAHPPARGLQQRQRRQERVHGRDEREAAAGQRAAAGQPRAVRRPEQVGLAQPPGAQQERRRRACARRRGLAGPPPASRAVEHRGPPPPAWPAAALAGTGRLQSIYSECLVETQTPSAARLRLPRAAVSGAQTASPALARLPVALQAAGHLASLLTVTWLHAHLGHLPHDSNSSGCQCQRGLGLFSNTSAVCCQAL